MATAATWEDFLTCAICEDWYNQPKRLPACPHVYCMECIRPLIQTPVDTPSERPLIQSKENSSYIICPECRQVQFLTEKGLDDLVNDIKSIGLIDSMRCTDCRGIHPHIVSSCPYCKYKICQPCLQRHKSSDHCDIINVIRQISTKIVKAGGSVEDVIEKQNKIWSDYDSKLENDIAETAITFAAVIQALEIQKTTITDMLEEKRRDSRAKKLSASVCNDIQATTQFVTGIKQQLNKNNTEHALSIMFSEVNRVDDVWRKMLDFTKVTEEDAMNIHEHIRETVRKVVDREISKTSPNSDCILEAAIPTVLEQTDFPIEKASSTTT